MIGNAIAQSVQPIISYNIENQPYRSTKAQRYAIYVAVAIGIGVTLAFTICPRLHVGLFLPLSTSSAQLAVEGLPLFGLGVTFFILNLAVIGYYQSTERSIPASILALLRGAFFIIPLFLLLPLWFGAQGIWLAMPASEVLTLFCAIALFIINRRGSVRGL